jgi:hypothetical protein
VLGQGSRRRGRKPKTKAATAAVLTAVLVAKGKAYYDGR